MGHRVVFVIFNFSDSDLSDFANRLSRIIKLKTIQNCIVVSG